MGAKLEIFISTYNVVIVVALVSCPAVSRACLLLAGLGEPQLGTEPRWARVCKPGVLLPYLLYYLSVPYAWNC